MCLQKVSVKYLICAEDGKRSSLAFLVLEATCFVFYVFQEHGEHSRVIETFSLKLHIILSVQRNRRSGFDPNQLTDRQASQPSDHRACSEETLADLLLV